MLAEPSYAGKASRERAVEALFERFAPPALFLAKNAVLSSFAMGRQSSLVVDAGHEGTVGKPHTFIFGDVRDDSHPSSEYLHAHAVQQRWRLTCRCGAPHVRAQGPMNGVL